MAATATAILIASLTACAVGDTAQSTEYQIKAAFIFNFLKFVDWPPDPNADPNSPIIIAVIGENPFAKAFEPLQAKQVGDRQVLIRTYKGCQELKDSDGIARFVDRPDLASIKACHILFVARSEKQHIKDILKPIENAPILTIADMPGFLEAGGVINFVLEDQKVRFETSARSAKRARLNIRAQLLRLATRVIKDDAEQTDSK